MVKVLDRECINRMTRNNRGGSGYSSGAGSSSYMLPLAADGTRGGVQIGYTTDTTNKKYAVQLYNEKMFVNVPWTDHTYTNGTGISLSGNTFAISDIYQQYISHGETAYGWGNHANAGYATQTWVSNRYLPLAGGDMTGSITMKGTDLLLSTTGSSSNDSGDIVWYYGNGNEKARIWTDDAYTQAQGLNFRLYKNDGTLLINNRLAIASQHLYLSGGTMTGTLGLKSNAYTGPSGDYGLNCNNSDIVNVNSIYTNDESDGWDEGIEFYRGDTGGWDSLRAYRGTWYFYANNGNSYGNIQAENGYAEGTWASKSDAREKNVLGDIELTVEEIAAMPAVRFTWKNRNDKQIHIGTLAQAWLKKLPEAVGRTENDRLTFSYGEAAAVCVVKLAQRVLELEEIVNSMRYGTQQH